MPPALGAGDVRARAAWALAEAEAEAGLSRVREVLEVELAELHEMETCNNPGLTAFRRLVLMLDLLPPGAVAEERRLAQSFVDAEEQRRARLRKSLRGLDRHLRAAEAKRRRALKVWLEVTRGKFQKRSQIHA